MTSPEFQPSMYGLHSSALKNNLLVSEISLTNSSTDTLANSTFINNKTSNYLQSIKDEFQITKPLGDIHQDFLESYELAYNESQISMIPIFKISKSFNHKTDINGGSLVIDIGGSTIRMAIIDFNNNNKSQPIKLQKQWFLNEDEKLIDLKFFQNLVNRAINLINDIETDDKGDNQFWKIGMTWSFPLNQQNQIITMGKGFHVSPEIQNRSIDELITSIFQNSYNINAKVVSIINDSIAVNLSGLINHDFNSQISFILGTGLNSCINKNYDLINTELGFFGKLPLGNITKYDRLLDSRWGDGSLEKPYLHNDSNNGNGVFMPLEFLSSGRYVSELLRLIIIDLIENDHINDSMELRSIIKEPFGLHGSFICSFDSNLSYQQIQSQISINFGISMTDEDIIILQSIIDMLLERTAIFVSQSIKALSKFVQDDEAQINVNYIGSFLYHCKELQSKISKYSHDTIHLNHIEHSSLIGAAVAVCINTHES